MTDKQAYEWLVQNRGVIAANLRLQVISAQGARELAARVVTWADTPEVCEMIEQAARYQINLLVDRD